MVNLIRIIFITVIVYIVYIIVNNIIDMYKYINNNKDIKVIAEQINKQLDNELNNTYNEYLKDDNYTLTWKDIIKEEENITIDKESNDTSRTGITTKDWEEINKILLEKSKEENKCIQKAKKHEKINTKHNIRVITIEL